MARSRKKTTTQRLLGAATAGLPAPVQQVVGSRWGAPLILLLLGGGILGTGIVKVQWSDGRPSVAIDRQRADEVKGKLKERVASIREQGTGDADASSVQDAIRRLASRDASGATGTSNASTGATRAEPAGGSLVPLPQPHSADRPRKTRRFLPRRLRQPLMQTVKIATFNIQVFGTSKLRNRR